MKHKPIYVTASFLTVLCTAILWHWAASQPQPVIPIVPGHGHVGVLGVDHDAPGHMKPRQP